SLARRTGLSQEVLHELTQAKVSLVSEPTPTPQVAQPGELPAPETDQNPAPRRQHQGPAPLRPRQAPVRSLVSLTPARLAATLLLEQPQLLQQVEDPSLPDADGDPQLALLHKLVDFLQQRPQATFLSIVGHWGGKYGVASQQELVSMVANQFV